MAQILVDLKDVIRALNVDEATLARLIREDKLPAYAFEDRAAPMDGGAASPAVQAETDSPPFEHRSDPGVFSALDYNKDAVPLFLHDAFAVVFRTYETFTCVRREHAHNDSVYRRMRQVFEDFGLDVSEFHKLAGRHRVSPGSWLCTRNAPRDFNRAVNVRVSQDKLRAYLVVYPARSAGTIKREDIEAALFRHGLGAHARNPQIDYMLRNGLFGHLLLLAEGEPAAAGRDAVLFYHFNRSTALTPRLLENGDVDFKNLENIPIVRAGDTLITKLPGDRGAPGRDVFGGEIPPQPGRDHPLRPGTNTRVAPDGNSVISIQEGHVFFSGGAVHVEEIYFVDGDVDYSVGNIDFIGIVVVNGSVREGFSIKAGGDIQINGAVEGARLESERGSIRIRLGVQGRNRAELYAARNVAAKYILSATVRAQGDVAVQEAIMHSDIEAGGRVLAEGARGSIIGGVTRAQDCISARTLGSEAQTRTVLELDCRDRATGALLRMDLDERRARALRELERADILLRRTRNAPGAPPGRNYLLKLQKYEALVKNLEYLQQEIDGLREEFGRSGRRGVRAMACMHPNVRIRIMGRATNIRDEQPGGRVFVTERGGLAHSRAGDMPAFAAGDERDSGGDQDVPDVEAGKA